VQTEKNKKKAFHYRHSSSTETYKNKTSESSNAKHSLPRRISQITKQLQYFPSQQTTDSSFLEKQAPEGSRRK
jgi:CII-binding regulator of phage lambda lysogenization HflD